MNNREATIAEMKNILGSDWVLSELDQTESYLYDETEPLLRPEADKSCIVVKPGSAEEISAIFKYANETKTPIIPRGGGTGVCGAAIPTESGIVMSLERLNRVLELDEDNLMITVEAGVTLEKMNEHINKQDRLFFPVHPGMKEHRSVVWLWKTLVELEQ